MSKKDFGKSGEEYAIKLLKKSGYKILDINFHTKFGEIDIVAQDGDTLIFVEVKTRSSKKHGRPEEAVTPRKLRNIRMAANYYIKTHNKLPRKHRIDVVALVMEGTEVFSERIMQVT